MLLRVILCLLAPLATCALSQSALRSIGERPPSRSLSTTRSWSRAHVVCGPTVKIVSVGKNKEKWLQTAIDEYTKRLRGAQIELKCVAVKGDERVVRSQEWSMNICTGYFRQPWLRRHGLSIRGVVDPPVSRSCASF